MKKELPKTEVDWSKFPKATQEKVGYVEPKQETLEDKLDRIVSKEPSKFLEESDKRMEAKAKLFRYSEEEVLEILYKHTEDMLAGRKVTLEEWFNKVKKK